MAATNEELRKKLAEQEERIKNQDQVITSLTRDVADLQRRSLGKSPEPSKPWAPTDYTQFMTMPPSAAAAMTAVVGNRAVADIVRENRPSPSAPAEPVKPIARGDGYQKHVPLGGVLGLEHVDAIAEADAARERAERVAKLMELAKQGGVK
jgi:hypothetical protein